MPSPATAGPAETLIETKLTPLALTEVTAEGVFDGYASLFDREDLGRDTVAPGAFRASLAQRGPEGVRMLFQHDPAEPLGTWIRLYEDARGLFARGRLTLEVTRAREVHALMKAGAIDGLSIGFRAVKGTRDRRTSVRRLERIDLWEISIVTFPMLPEARVRNVKGGAGRGRDAPVSANLEGQRRNLTADAPNLQPRLLAQIEEAARLLRQR